MIRKMTEPEIAMSPDLGSPPSVPQDQLLAHYLSLLVDRQSEISLVTDSNTPLRVIASPAFWNEASNPYNALLYRALSTLGVVVEESSLRALVRAAANIWHVHWPGTEI